ncbi:MAG: nuclear transport factor 2 family protein [Gammaproteobacteria bacterium]|nr:nuclear transport factor 2 family protein [Gammaproteobacteria bacterium]
MENTELAEQLFRAFESGDADTVRSLCKADMTAIQNLNPPMDLETLLEFSSAVNKVVPDLHYADVKRSATETGFVEEHSVLGTLPNGSELRLAACVVAEISEGKIRSLREYLDTSAAEGLLKALS